MNFFKKKVIKYRIVFWFKTNSKIDLKCSCYSEAIKIYSQFSECIEDKKLYISDEFFVDFSEVIFSAIDEYEVYE